MGKWSLDFFNGIQSSMKKIFMMKCFALTQISCPVKYFEFVDWFSEG